MIRNITLLCIALGFKATLSAQPGTPDSDFDADGLVVSPAPDGLTSMDIEDLALQSDGSIVVVGDASGAGTNFGDIIVARYRPDGSWDNSFAGGDGYRLMDFANGSDRGWAIVVQPDDKILVGGWGSYDEDAVGKDFVIKRLLVNGGLDGTFDSDATQTIDINGADDYLMDILLRADAKILMIGSATPEEGFDSDLAVVQLNTDGSLDATFSFDGIQRTSFSAGSYESAQKGALDGTGRLVVACEVDDLSGIVRYLPDGALDASFSGDGKVLTDGLPSLRLSNLVIAQDNSIFAVGRDEEYDIVVAHVLVDGTLDPAYGNAGYVRVVRDIAQYPTGVQLQPNGRLIIVGFEQTGPTGEDWFMVRLLPDGSPDNGFGNEGWVVLDIGGQPNEQERAQGLVIQPDNKILVGGSTDDPENGIIRPRFALARFLNDQWIGVVEFTTATTVLIYPNPVADRAEFTFELKQEERLTAEIHDAQGKVVHTLFIGRISPPGQYRETVDLNGLAAGQYLLVLSNNTGSTTIKLTKKNP